MDRHHEPEEPQRSEVEGETVYLTAQLETKTRFEIRPQVFVPAAFIVVTFALLGAIFPDTLAEGFAALQGSIVRGLGWFYKLAVSAFLVFVVWLALSRHGKKRLGPDDSRPDFGVFSWFAMLFSAGMGIGLLFFSVAEPISHFTVDLPPGSESAAGTPEAAQHAMTLTFFHWGLHAWAIYIVVGLALCYFAYRRGLPLALRSAFHPLLGDRIYGWGGDAIDVLAIVGTLFGVATSLGIGAIQISAGIGYLSEFQAGLGWQLSLVAVITVIATMSVVAGLDRGIRRLSLLNVVLSGLLTLFVLVTGPTVFILDGLVHSLGEYAVQVAGLSLETYPFADGDWEALWTLFYWGWWVSWSPFVGMFIARISRGRTIREFITGVLLAPTVVTFIFLAVFGWAAFDADMAGGGHITEAVEANPDVALFVLLDGLPVAPITSLLAIFAITVFFVTSSDSGSLVDDIHASGGNVEPHHATRVFWALMEGAVAATLLAAGGATGLEALQHASIATGVPLAILILGACWALVRAFRLEEEDPSLIVGSDG